MIVAGLQGMFLSQAIERIAFDHGWPSARFGFDADYDAGRMRWKVRCAAPIGDIYPCATCPARGVVEMSQELLEDGTADEIIDSMMRKTSEALLAAGFRPDEIPNALRLAIIRRIIAARSGPEGGAP